MERNIVTSLIQFKDPRYKDISKYFNRIREKWASLHRILYGSGSGVSKKLTSSFSNNDYIEKGIDQLAYRSQIIDISNYNQRYWLNKCVYPLLKLPDSYYDISKHYEFNESRPVKEIPMCESVLKSDQLVMVGNGEAIIY